MFGPGYFLHRSVCLRYFGILQFLHRNFLVKPVSDEVSDHNKKVAENRLSSQIFAIIEHYHQEDPLGIPGAPVI